MAGAGLPWKKTPLALQVGVEPQQSPVCHEELEHQSAPAEVSEAHTQ